MKTETDGHMKGGVRAPRGPNARPSFLLDLGRMPAQRCPACTAAKMRPSPLVGANADR